MSKKQELFARELARRADRAKKMCTTHLQSDINALSECLVSINAILEFALETDKKLRWACGRSLQEVTKLEKIICSTCRSRIERR